MSIGRLFRAADCPEIPWKNGGGTTREIAVLPPGAGAEDFLWRLSLAKVERAGAFSTFAGVDRVLAVARGTLHLIGPDERVELHEGAGTYAFDGDAPIRGEPREGGALALNAMARSGAWCAEIRWLHAGDTAQARGATFLCALQDLPLGGAVLRRLDCAELDRAVELPAAALLVTFLPT